jgi:hypothetical protein
MRFAFIDAWRHQWRVAILCRVMRVSERGYRSWRTRPTSTHARTDLKVLAHIREQYSLSLGSYGRPRMTPKGIWVTQRGRPRCGRAPCWSADDEEAQMMRGIIEHRVERDQASPYAAT